MTMGLLVMDYHQSTQLTVKRAKVLTSGSFAYAFGMDTKQKSPFDVVVIGAGVAGCFAARELSKYDLRTLVLESGNDIACGATRANSAIVHAGFDPTPGTLKAKYNVEGSKLYPDLACDLHFAFKNNGSLVVAYSDEELAVIHDLVARGKQNGVEGVRFIDHDELMSLEPNVNDKARGALLAPTGGICNPYQVAFSAIENAVQNGVQIRFNTKVEHVEKATEGASEWNVICDDGTRIACACVVNAAGVYADDIHNQVSAYTIHITPRRGEYCLFDTDYGSTFTHTMFQAPTAQGKGVLVTPTTHGNLLVGPNAVAQSSKTDVSTSTEGLNDILSRGAKTWPNLSRRGIITNFCGIRATGDTGDFVVGQPDDAPGFFDIACFDSPGLTSAPAVARDVASDVASLLHARKNVDFDPQRRGVTKLFAQMSDKERAQAIAEDPRAGQMVCRCCSVTEADIFHAFESPIPVLDIDCLKWRCGAMMGRCHGGFCTPEIVKIFSYKNDVVPNAVDKRLPGSKVVLGGRPDYIDLARDQFAEQSEQFTKIKQSAHTQNGDTKKAMPRICFAHGTIPYDVCIVGGGAAGIAAATAAYNHGAHHVILLDREGRLGGILKQCVHNGFGLHRFRTELTGPEYATREIHTLAQTNVKIIDNATTVRIDPAHKTGDAHTVVAVSPEGDFHIKAFAVVLATGSRERGAGALNMSGSRPSGVFSAGSAQNFMNLQGCRPGNNVVILGSGDIGLIMARRMVSQGANVLGVYEIMPHPSGLRRNIVQCLDDYDIPLHLSTTVVRLEGDKRLSAVWVQNVDAHTLAPIPGTMKRIPCDTLLLSVGLLPENEVAKSAHVAIDPATNGAVVDENLETSVPGIYECGNSLHIHDLVDHASAEGDIAGAAAAMYALTNSADASDRHFVPVNAGSGVGYVVPQRIDPAHIKRDHMRVSFSFRVRNEMKNPQFCLYAYNDAGEKQKIASRKALIAVPAEMAEMHVRADKFCNATRFELVAQAQDLLNK